MQTTTIAVTASMLTIGGVATGISGDTTLQRRFRTWLVAAPVVLVPLLLVGTWGAAALAVVLGVVASREFGALTTLPRRDTIALAVRVGLLPVVAVALPELMLALVLTLPFLAAGSALATADTTDGLRRAALGAFGTLWIGGGLVGLVLLEPAVVVAVVLAVAVADVAAWCGGKTLGRRGPLARGLTVVSPNKTWGGVVGALIGATAVLAILAQAHIGLVAAVVVGGTVGDLLESMVKRAVGRKDAAGWLPGFGGLLDRIDSLLVALPLSVLTTVVTTAVTT